MSRRVKNAQSHVHWRLQLVRFVFVALFICLGWRLADIEVLHPEFLRHQGDARHVRYIDIPAHRGMILDRMGEPLAVSTPVHSIWVNPQDFSASRQQIRSLARLLGLSVTALKQKLAKSKHKGREFVYLKRRVTPETARQVKALHITGVSLQKEYKRYYPAGEVAAHLIGFNNIDDHGQEGLELAYDDSLTGIPGKKRMIRDSRGNYVGGGEQIKASKDGENIQISIDLRLQYLLYQTLKATVRHYQADAAAAVILDVNTGEVLAMANQPSFNPNNRRGLKVDALRNRAVIDLFEPGSTVKPFTITSALKSGRFTPESQIDTHPGQLKIHRLTVKDHRDYGVITPAIVLKKSSNVGASKIALTLEPAQLWQDFSAFGMGQLSGGYFPGEHPGKMPDLRRWNEVGRATLSYGYGLSTSVLQLARAYTVLANGGILRPVSFLKLSHPPQGKRVFPQPLMKRVLGMMRGVIEAGGTGTRAAVENYTVAGKTGTARKAIRGGYAEDQYLSLFAGIIPASRPRLAMVVMVDNPKGGAYYGGLVAAPVFATVMSGAMRLLNIPPDKLPEQQLRMAQQ